MALHPLVQTWYTTFWVKNQDENGNSGYCLDFNADRTEGTVSGRTFSASGASDHDYSYESSRFKFASCNNRANHFVCEKDLH